MRATFDTLCVFLLLFTTKVPYFYNSTILLFLFLSLISFFNIKNVYRNFKYINTVFFQISTWLVLIIFISFLYPFAHSTYDFSIIKTFINQLISLLVVILFLINSFNGKKNHNYYINIIIASFTIQSIIIITSLLSPSFKSIIEITQSDETIYKSLVSYGGYRNLAFGSTQFFGLNALYGFVLFLIIYVYENNQKHPFLYLIVFLLAFIGCIFTGRTGLLVGTGLAIYYYFSTNNRSIKRIFISLFVLTITIIFVVIIISNFLPDFVRQWAFQLFYNFSESGEFTSTSSEHLFKEMYFLPDFSTFFLGDGYYTNEDGSYYQHTDAGYMRNLLFFGIIGFLTLALYELFIIKKIEKNMYILSNKQQKSFMTSIIAYILILHIKGEVIGFLVSLQTMLFLILFSFQLYVSYKPKNNHTR
ncbi:MAG: hypothetical protein U2P89_07145 [Proteiniphilum sp.]|uniref:hypothetical protein n=1 Tax=Proteiniphilum sp. TaxID=1926877 RepID=UPI002AB9440E|nr:hypothetical protein [Proteiniphilum sp.]MDY9918634.1 hypothetical protein [Proteiniphilum sp.]